METEDINVALAKVQQAIRSHLGIDADSLVFDYSENEGKTALSLITLNPRHNQSFLFYTVEGINKLDAVNRMYEYVRNYKDSENSYTIQWMAKGDTTFNTSYFSAKNMYEALDKLYYNRDINAITVYSIVMNPVA